MGDLRLRQPGPTSLFPYKPELLHESLRLRVVSAEVAVKHVRILRVAFREYVVTETVTDFCIKYAFFLKQGEGISLKNLHFGGT